MLVEGLRLLELETRAKEIYTSTTTHITNPPKEKISRKSTDGQTGKNACGAVVRAKLEGQTAEKQETSRGDPVEAAG
jgi:hypothetical protein